MKKILEKPFPAIVDTRKRLLSAVFIGLFVSLFLWVFKPFGLNNVQGNLLFVVLVYGGVTFAAIVFVQVPALRLFPGFYNEDRWSVGREIAHTLFIILVVSLGNLIVSAWFGFFEPSFANFLRFLGFTLAVGIFPVVIQVLIRQNVYQGKNSKASEKISETLHPEKSFEEVLELKNEDDNTELTVKYSDLLYLEAADNYVKIFFINGDGIKYHMIRNTMAYFEDAFGTRLFRCHRSYLVNLNKIRKVSGNARGYLLDLGENIPRVPVSRRKLEDFETAMAAV